MVQRVGAARNRPPTPPKTAGRGAGGAGDPLLPTHNPVFIFFMKKALIMRPLLTVAALVAVLSPTAHATPDPGLRR
jgi:hypothetical protein